jgi:hypothetical protein
MKRQLAVKAVLQFTFSSSGGHALTTRKLFGVDDHEPTIHQARPERDEGMVPVGVARRVLTATASMT